ncbi:transglutaminase N-terminal domain-containing protein [Spirosoma sp. KUDC1026]|uniref:transglutaminase family protein n=1 Tax=Spirosoma sp. KUDC1026 TaxID=2745947 RepID=UPI00159BCAA0|nr:transglutaminase family protein [Spirosoma sp. KUDC1026]QKZ12732.1 transglutaminase family protein [Spirosoma sp. KUDC1026]
MTTRVELLHQTHYHYERPVLLSAQWVRLKPAVHCLSTIESYQLTIEPTNHLRHWQQDPFGNLVARIDFLEVVESVTIQVQLIAKLEPVNPFDFLVDACADNFPFMYEPQIRKALTSYLEVTEHGPRLTQWVRQINQQPRRSTIDFLVGLTQQIYQMISYQSRLQAGVQPAEVTLQRASGSCRDSAWLLVQLIRSLGLATRFVSGYLVQLAPDTPGDTPSDGLGRDTFDLHAWAEVYVPGAGWIGLDATSGLLTTQGHIPLASAPAPAGAAPIEGTTESVKTWLTYSSTLIRLP